MSNIWIGLEYINKRIANVIAVLTSRRRDLVCILGYRPPNSLRRFQPHEILECSSTIGNNKKKFHHGSAGHTYGIQ